jgi:L-fuculose-phosphate aldolase
MMQAAFNLLAVPQDSGGATTDQGIPIADAQAQNKNVEKVAFAIVHAHPLAATTLSLVADSINPLDSEGSLILGGSVPVLAPAQTIASEEAAEMLAAMVAAGGKCAMIRGHGSFALAATLAEALELTVCLERSARIILLAR